MALYCLDLPPELRYKPENVFICSITPAPDGPDALNLHNLLDPIVDEFKPFSEGIGVSLPTHDSPDGANVRVRIAPLLADTPARSLFSGFLSTAAIHFCAFCHCTNDEVERLDLKNWTLREGAEVKSQARDWKAMLTKSAKEAAEKKNGVRWTSFHRLPYWDPVKHVVLGYMHNWLEGVLEDHLRVLWGIGRNQAHEKRAADAEEDFRRDREEEKWEESDVTDSASELESLHREVVDFNSQTSTSTLPTLAPGSQTPPPEPQFGDAPENESVHSDSTVQANQNPPDHLENVVDEDEDEEDEDYVQVPDEVFNLHPEYHTRLKRCIRDITLPTWVGRPPANLGEASHGSLRAYDYLVLYSFIFPLVVPEFWWSPDASPLDKAYLKNFQQLVVCTNIVCAYQTSTADANEYTKIYTRYRRGIHMLYPYWRSKPNYHYAMHNGEFLKFWGPLPPISEFPGERLIGTLQDVKTNRKLRKLMLQNELVK